MTGSAADIAPLVDVPLEWADAGTLRLAYRRLGEGPPVMLIMGLGADGLAWTEHVASWSAHRTCFAVDNRGAGASDAPTGPYTTAMMADDYAGLIRVLGVGPVPVVGISMGGAIAQELALRHPELVSRLALVSTWGRCDPYTVDVFRALSAGHQYLPPDEFARLLQLWIWSPDFVAGHPDRLDADRAGAGAAPMPQESFAAQVEACLTHDATDRLGRIAAPTLITVGTADVFTPRHYAEDLAAAIPGARLEVFERAGHAHHWQDLPRFNDLIGGWL